MQLSCTLATRSATFATMTPSPDHLAGLERNYQNTSTLRTLRTVGVWVLKVLITKTGDSSGGGDILVISLCLARGEYLRGFELLTACLKSLLATTQVQGKRVGGPVALLQLSFILLCVYVITKESGSIYLFFV